MSSFTGVYQELACAGVADKVMTASTLDQAQTTFWRFVFLKSTMFALEPVNFDSSGAAARFGGQRVKYTFPRQGDLAWHTYARITLPGIVSVTGATATNDLRLYTDPATASYWCNAVGQYLLQEVRLAVGGTVIDTLFDVFLYMWEELSGKPGKRLSEMIGKYETTEALVMASKRSRVMYVPLYFWFTDNTGLALPLVSLQFHNVTLEITFAARSACIVNQTAGVDVYIRPDGATDAEIQAGDVSLASLLDTSMECTIESTYVYLDHDERSKFAHGQFEQIITELQDNSTQVSSSNSAASEATPPTKLSVKLTFNHVVQEKIIAIRQQANEDANDHYNFGGFFDDYTNLGGSGLTLDPLTSLTILFNNSQRVQKREGAYFRLVQPYQHHTCIPRGFIYVYSYAIDAEDAQPCGGFNASRIDNVYLNFEIDTRVFYGSGNSSADVFIYGRSRNLMRYKHGLVSKKFA